MTRAARPGRPCSGRFGGGLPFDRRGRGPRPLLVFPGLAFENQHMDRLTARFVFGAYRDLLDAYTVFVVARRAGLQEGVSVADMAADYAAMIAEEFGGPVDVVGTSSGGSIALQFAADHPRLTRRLVVHSAAHTLGPRGKEIQLEAARLAARGQWGRAAALLMEWVLPSRGAGRLLTRCMRPLAALAMSSGAPKDPADFVATVEAENAFAFRDRLGEIKAPTLVVAGAEDPGYTPRLFRETAEGIPGSRLLLYEGMGHPARGRRFRRDLTEFLLHAQCGTLGR